MEQLTMVKTVAAVVVTYHRKQLLLECIHALLSQTRSLDKIILIDNASTDSTPNMLREKGYMDNAYIDSMSSQVQDRNASSELIFTELRQQYTEVKK